MLYRYLLSKKGYTFVEVMTVVIVMGILVAVAVPVFGAGLKAQRKKDCNSQKTMIKSTVQQAMYGMIDNGRKQDELYVMSRQSDHRDPVPACGSGYDGEEAFVVSKAEGGDPMGVTLGDIRNGYRPEGQNSDYKWGCEGGLHDGINYQGNHYLKKQDLDGVRLYKYFSNQDLPICPFAENADKDYFYYILWDDSLNDVVIVCSHPDCNEAE